MIAMPAGPILRETRYGSGPTKLFATSCGIATASYSSTRTIARRRRDLEELNRGGRLARRSCRFGGLCVPHDFQPIQLDDPPHVLNLCGVGSRHGAFAGTRIGGGVMLTRRFVASVSGECGDGRQGLQPF